MKLRLYASKQEDAKDYYNRSHIRLAVIDLGKSENYPANFVCMLPYQPSVNGKVNNIFSKLFGKDSLELAKQLLNEALKTERDLEIKANIEERLKLLEPKSPVQVKCCVCGNFFEPKRRRFKEKICQECTQKKYAIQK